jgi:hypothetical protein
MTINGTAIATCRAAMCGGRGLPDAADAGIVFQER